MAVINNKAGTILMSDKFLAELIGRSVEQCYGVVGMASMNASDGWAELLHREHYEKGIQVTSNEETIEIDLFIIVQYGVSLVAVTQSLIENIKYTIENMTSLKVSAVNVHIEGIRV